MKIVIIGGSGLIGKKMVALLQAQGHEVVAASPRTGVNAVTGEGLEAALRGARVVVDVSNAPSWEDEAVLAFFQSSTQNLLEAEQKAGVEHHLALSVVGTEKLQGSGYFRAKLAQEQLIQRSPVPYTIVRATQFFEFLAGIAQGSARDGVARLSPRLFQPVAADDVAAFMAEVALEPPHRAILELGGPEQLSVAEAVARVEHGVEIIADEQAGYFGAEIDDQTLTARAGARRGPTLLEDWLLQTVTPAAG